MRGSAVVGDVIESRPFTGFQWRTAILCAAVIFMEGYDAQAVGYVAPSMSAALHVGRGALGPVLAAAIVGLMLGGFLIAPLADRIGRRKVIIGSTLAFGLLSLATPLVDSIAGLAFLRLLTGLGLGGAMPNVISLTSEYSPRRINGRVVMVMFCGFSLGSAGGGFAAAALIADFGWRSIFIVGGILPLLLLPLLVWALPESIRYLALRPNGQLKALQLLARIDPAVASAERVGVSTEEKHIAAMSVRQLFAEGRTGGTLMLWIIFAMSLLDIAMVASWLPTVLNAGGATLKVAALTGSLFQIGGIAGTLLMGAIIDRVRAEWMLLLAYLLGALCLGLVGQVDPQGAEMFVVVAFAGFGIVGGQIAANAVAARFYPTPIRSTGIGWAFGVGRIGSIAAPMVGGMLLGLQIPPAQVFVFSVVPTLLAAAASLGLAFTRRLRDPEVAGAPFSPQQPARG